jgi:3-hydroxyisobutyrate dehydrogenase
MGAIVPERKRRVIMERIGYIGLGIMGRGMAHNILRAGFPLTVWNRSPERMSGLIEAGATAGDSPADVAAKSDIIFICVSDTPDVEQVILGENGVIHGAKEGALVIDTSTISPKATREIADQLDDWGISMLDAPVSGGSEGAEKGTLSIMVGGEEASFSRAKPIFEAIGKTITHMGPNGSGQATKLVNQILCVANMLAASEALLLAQASGLDLTKTLQAVGGGAGGSWMLVNRGPQVAARDFRPGFTIDLQQKDLRLVLEAADELGLPLSLTSTIHGYYNVLQRQGLGDDGNHALVKALEQLSGITVGS